MKIGDVFYVVPSSRGRGAPYELKITKVGRKYAYASQYHENDTKIDIKAMCIDNGQYSPSGYLFTNKEEYESKVKRSDVYLKLKNKIPYSIPEKVTLEDIKSAAKLLNVDIGE